MHKITKRLTLLLAVCVMAMTAAPAFAQPGTAGYQSGGENAAGQIQGGSENIADTTTGEGGSLPFTGLDVALILAVGGVMVAVGFGTRRLTRHADAA